jgi:L-ascorbate metabolism protein UlaG (beta-lactamase superfamily)
VAYGGTEEVAGVSKQPRWSRRAPRRRTVAAGRLLRWALAATLAAGVARTLHEVAVSLGGRPAGDRAERIRRSPQYRAGAFRNPAGEPVRLPEADLGLLRRMLLGDGPRRPTRPVPLVRTPPHPPPADLCVTWYGHATALLEIEGRRVLLDPVWSERCSPAARIGPRRLHPVPVRLAELGPLDAVLISHDHYDHLDLATVRALTRHGTAPFLVPLGVGAHLDAWGVPAARIIELDWTESRTVAGLRFTATAARHFSGRGPARDNTLWGSWVVRGARRRIFYSGDSGYFAGYRDIGTRYGPFDLTLIQIGAYDRAWPNMHMFPEEAVRAHLDLRGDLLVPVHWATFNLAPHAWAEPVERLWHAARSRGVRLVVPRPGQRVNVADPPALDCWWRAVA